MPHKHPSGEYAFSGHSLVCYLVCRKKTLGKAVNVFVLISLKHWAAAATAGNNAGMTHNFCKSCQPIKAAWFKSAATSTVECVEC